MIRPPMPPSGRMGRAAAAEPDEAPPPPVSPDRNPDRPRGLVPAADEADDPEPDDDEEAAGRAT